MRSQTKAVVVVVITAATDYYRWHITDAASLNSHWPTDLSCWCCCLCCCGCCCCWHVHFGMSTVLLCCTHADVHCANLILCFPLNYLSVEAFLLTGTNLAVQVSVHSGSINCHISCCPVLRTRPKWEKINLRFSFRLPHFLVLLLLICITTEVSRWPICCCCWCCCCLCWWNKRGKKRQKNKIFVS